MEKILMKNEKLEILELCKIQTKELKKEEDKYTFVNLNRDMFKDNKYILDKYFRNEYLEKCYYANLLAFKNRVNITFYQIKKELKQDFGKAVSLAGYKYNPEHYRFEEWWLQDEHDEDLFRNKSKEQEELELYNSRRNPVDTSLDFEAMERLNAVLFKGLESKLLIILHLEDIPGIINNALDCYSKGVSCGPSNAIMHNKIKEIRTLLENKEVVEWLKTNPTDLMFDKNLYISTYQKVLRQITDIRDSRLDYCEELLSYDEHMEDILSNEYIELDNIYNSDSENDEDFEYTEEYSSDLE